MAEGYKVWIDQDLCTGDGLCAEIAPEVFFGGDDGLYYVKEEPANFTDITEVQKFDGIQRKKGGEGLARVPAWLLDAVVEAAEECPGECIFLEQCN